ncbi:hypothetical protein KO481_10405 [Nocardia sp. NEAU-G5]|uniref:Core-binding (CB) domain-containing protein n=1 Tax=Nocardia albiluteola TaxID=2842303 RepID=A0ABS6AWL4_9NOCA|nr:hypothetical protein [Nocardia albiluteola]MBU3061935.1 hypothetical protein [Nocardia albiluteola]
MAHVGGWSLETLRRRGDQLRRVLAANGEDRPIRLSQVRAELGNVWQSRIAARVLEQCGRLVDDTESPTRQWIDRRTATLPPGFRDDVRAWMLVLHEGEERARPRAEATLRAYFSRAHPPLTEWASTRSHLREVTQADVSVVLNRLTGHKRVGTFVALRSLFRFAKRHRLVFVDPTRRLRVGAAPSRVPLPLTDDQVDAVTATAVTPMQIANNIEIPRIKTSLPQQFQNTADHTEQLRRCLTDDTLPLPFRIIGALVRLYALPVARILELTVDRFSRDDTNAYLIIDQHPVVMPPSLAALIEQQIQHAPATTRPAAQPPYLLPGCPPSRPRNIHGVSDTLNKLGLPSLAARNTAMMANIADLDTIVVTDMFGVSPTSAHRWAAYAQTSWAQFLACTITTTEQAPDGMPGQS